MAISKQIKEFFYSLSATDKYSDFDSRKSFNRVNKPDAHTSLLGASNANDSSVSLTKVVAENEGVHETRLAWRHIKKWLHNHSEDLNNSLSAACTESDINELEKDLGCTFPASVSEFFRLTDGQNTYNDNGACGLFFGLRLLPIDEVAVSTESWRNVHRSIKQGEIKPNAANGAVYSGAEESTTGEETAAGALGSDMDGDLGIHRQAKVPEDLGAAAGFRRQKSRFPEQNCVPPGSILASYAHFMWIPIITDGAGNYIGIDLSPGTPDAANIPNAVSGQVILFGRDFDTKFRIADNFGDFLLLFANDLEKGNWDLRSSSDDEDMISGVDTELVYMDHVTKKETPYLDILRDRVIEHWVQSLAPEEAENPETKALLAQLADRHSYHIPVVGNNTDSLIAQNLNKIDLAPEERSAVKSNS